MKQKAVIIRGFRGDRRSVLEGYLQDIGYEPMTVPWYTSAKAIGNLSPSLVVGVSLGACRAIRTGLKCPVILSNGVFLHKVMDCLTVKRELIACIFLLAVRAIMGKIEHGDCIALIGSCDELIRPGYQVKQAKKNKIRFKIVHGSGHKVDEKLAVAVQKEALRVRSVSTKTTIKR